MEMKGEEEDDDDDEEEEGECSSWYSKGVQ